MSEHAEQLLRNLAEGYPLTPEAELRTGTDGSVLMKRVPL